MLRYDAQPPIAWMTLDRPEKLNAMPRSLWSELREALARAAADDDVRVVVFRGEGTCFSVGGDIEGFGELGDVRDRRASVLEAAAALKGIEDLSKPTIAAVHGHALGGGCELTIYCDVVIADETARFGLPEATVGLVPGLALAHGLAHLNVHWLKYMAFTGRTLTAEEARLAGLVNLVVPAGKHLAAAEALAADVAARAPLALAATKAMLQRGQWENLPHAVDAVTMLHGTADVAEGIAAFTERRKPEFEGR